MKRVFLLTQIHNIIVSQTFFGRSFALSFFPDLAPVVWNAIKYNLKIDLNIVIMARYEKLCYHRGTHFFFSLRPFSYVSTLFSPHFSSLGLLWIVGSFFSCYPAYALAETFNHFKDSPFTELERRLNGKKESQGKSLRPAWFHRVYVCETGVWVNVYR